MSSSRNSQKTRGRAPKADSDASVLKVTPNERRVMDLILRREHVTRAEITHEVDLTAQSISRIVDALVERGLISIGTKVVQGRGQPSARLVLNQNAAFGVGLSIMTDAVSGTVMDLSGAVVARHWQRLTAVDLDTVLETCRSVYDALLRTAGVGRHQVAGIGAAVTGYFVSQGRRLNPPSPLDALHLVEIDQILTTVLRRPVWVDNDGNLAAMGETLSGIGRTTETFGYLFFAMGLGGAVVINGRLFPGAFGNAGEFAGILPPQMHDERPTLELLRQMMAQRGRRYGDIYEMIQHFDISDPGVEDWIERSVPKLSAVASAIAAVLDPQAIVLGGRIPKPLAARLCDEIEFYSVPRRGMPKPFPKLVVSEVQGDAAAIGAAAMPLKARFFL